MSSGESVGVVEPSFLNTETLQILGRDGFIIMIVGCFLCLILVICCIAMIVWYCKSTRSKVEGKTQQPQLGVIMPVQSSKQSAASALPLSPNSEAYVDTMAPSAARATVLPQGYGSHQAQTAQSNGAFNSQEEVLVDDPEDQREFHV